MDKFKKQQKEIDSLRHTLFVLKALHSESQKNTDFRLRGYDDEIELHIERLEKSLANKEKELRGTYGSK